MAVTGDPGTVGGPAADQAPLLSRDAARRLPAENRPAIYPGDVPAGIVHIGLGAFHRAHQAVFTEAAIAAKGGDWAIVGVAPRNADVVHRLAAQDLLHSVTTLAGAGSRTNVIGALAGVRHAAGEPGAVVALIADPGIRIVTLTVTEKAYQLDPATGRLRPDDELIADLTTGRPPRTVPGLLVRGLLARAAADAGPLALVSCDNLPANGRRLREMITDALAWPGARRDTRTPVSALDIEWVRGNVSFPATMVDRIVPASTAQTLDAARRALGVRDLVAVAAEPYRQWVIEDDFPAGRPAWDSAGAVLTGDVGAWERLKLRTLNGVHSAVAYLGALAGRETIAETLHLPGLVPLLNRLIAEDIAPSLTPPAGITVRAYGATVLERFANPVIGHRTLQVAMDGTQKLQQRILHTIADRRTTGATPHLAALVVAAWMRFVQGAADDGRDLPLDDPLAAEISAALADAPQTPEGVCAALLGLRAVFPAELAGDEVVRAEICAWLSALTRHGAAATVAGAS